MTDLHLIPARKGAAARLRKDQTLRVINTHGSQVVDFWAFNASDLGEFMSMEHSRIAFRRIVPVVGNTMVTNRRQPILTVVADTSPGIHDTLVASCDSVRYRQLGVEGFHDNCTDNLRDALQSLGLQRIVHPCPFNLFMNVPLRDDGSFTLAEPRGKPGDSIAFRAEMDAVVAFSACPMDLIPINGKDCVVHDAHFEIQ